MGGLSKEGGKEKNEGIQEKTIKSQDHLRGNMKT